MKRILLLLLLPIAAHAQSVFSCGPAGTSWASSGTCGADATFVGKNFGFNGNGPPALSGNSVVLMPSGATHQADTINYAAAKVSTQGFTSTFTFVPNGYNIAFILQNNTISSAATTGAFFTAGATCEAAFFQGFTPPPNNVFALKIDSQESLDGSGTFTNSGTQIFMGGQTPCTDDDAQTSWFQSTQISTSPISLNSPATSAVTTTGHTYSVSVGYDGSNFSECLYDVTAANGSCSSSTSGTGTFFQHTWTNVPIPAWTNGTTAYVGLATASNASVGNALTVFNWNFSTVTPTATPTSAHVANGGTYAANPTFSPAAGSYSGTQSVALSTATSGAYICYSLGASGQSVTPNPDNRGTCSVGTKYTGAVSVSSSQTLYAVAGTDNTSCPGTCPSTNLPSGTAQAAYTITGGTAAVGSTISTSSTLSTGTVLK